MEHMKALYTTTQHILSTLNKEYHSVDERTSIIVEVNKLLDDRETLIHKIEPPYSSDEKKIAKKVITLDREIKQKMEEVKLSIRNDLKKLKRKKDSNLTYINPYKHMETVDGMYLDNKL